MKRRTSRLLSTLLALCMVPALLPAPAQAVESSLQDWYFLFAIFKNVDADCADGKGTTTHTKYTMSREEADAIRGNAKAFEEYMNSAGVIRAHVDIVEIDATVTELSEADGSGSYIAAELAAPFLEKVGVDLDRYDHVTCVVSLNVATKYVGITGSEFENGTGESCINFDHARKYFNPVFPESVYVHEFLHFMERMSKRWGAEFDLHGIGDEIYAPTEDEWKVCYTDIIMNQVKGKAELGTGVSPLAWQCPPHVFRTIRELTIPDGMTSIGHDAFLNCTNLENVIIPGSVTLIDVSAFNGCSNLKNVIITSSVTSIEGWAFAYCSSLESVTIPSSVASIGSVAFYGCSSLKDVYYGGSAEQWKQISIDNENNWNAPLLNATIHYNSTGPSVPPTSGTPSAPVPTSVVLSPQKLAVNGKDIDCEKYNIDGSNYFKLRDLAYVLNGTGSQFGVGYDAAASTVTIITGAAYESTGTELATDMNNAATTQPSSQSIRIDGEAHGELTVYNIGGSNFFQLRELGNLLNFEVGYDQNTNTAIVRSVQK